ncbi:MAG: SRPBCC family protein [Candidatus Nanopelagicales bacterium]
MQIEVSRMVDAPARRVWRVITDVESSPGVISAIQSVDILAGPSPLAVGTRWRETRTMFGRQATEEMTVTRYEPGRSYTVAASGQGTDYESTLEVLPDGNRCTLRMTFSAVSASAMSRVLSATVGRLFLGATRRSMEQDLSDIASAAEGATS